MYGVYKIIKDGGKVIGRLFSAGPFDDLKEAHQVRSKLGDGYIVDEITRYYCG